MADTSNNGVSGSGKLKPRAKKRMIRLDMTPMVDLAFLLLTFFILTTTLAEQKSLDIILPTDAGEPQPVNNAITVILTDQDKLFYYEGQLADTTHLIASNFKAIRNIILRKNQPVIKNYKRYLKQHPGVDVEKDSVAKADIKKIFSDKRGAYVILKYDNKARYVNVIDIIDEMDICAVPKGKYAIVKKLESQEEEMLEKMKLTAIK